MNDIELFVDPVRQSTGASDLHASLRLTQAFVTVLLAGNTGPLTPVQQDLLYTINERISRLLVEDVRPYHPD